MNIKIENKIDSETFQPIKRITIDLPMESIMDSRSINGLDSKSEIVRLITEELHKIL